MHRLARTLALVGALATSLSACVFISRERIVEREAPRAEPRPEPPPSPPAPPR